MASFCKACGAPIVWVKSDSDRWLPCDEGLIPYQLDGPETLVTWRGAVINCRTTFEGEPDGMAYKSHFATCQKADQMRRPRR